MAYNIPLCSPHEIRNLLNNVFDDADLDAFCLDFFPEVYDYFGRGLQKKEKLTILLKYCHRPNSFKMLLKAIYEYDHPEFHTFFQAKGIEIHTIQPESHQKSLRPYEIAMAHNFDLNELVTECLDHLIGVKQGLLGFTVPSHSPSFVSNFCERLKHEWERNRIRIKPSLVISPIHTPIDRAILTISRQYLPALRESDVLFAVQISGQSMVNRFWQHLRRMVKDEILLNRLIVIMAVNTNCASPQNAISLGQPEFRSAHVLRWVRKVVQSLAWPEEVVQVWTDHIIAECSIDNELQIDWVYNHLGDALELLKQNPTVEWFQQELIRRKQLYDQTSN